jgi:hypothetical protein
MLSAVNSKLAAIIKTKEGSAIVAALVVGGGGTALAMTATHGNLAQLGSALGARASSTADSGNHEGDDVSVEGVLQTFTPSRSGGTIVVQKEDNGTVTIAVDANTRVNGERASTLTDLAQPAGHEGHRPQGGGAGQEAIG